MTLSEIVRATVEKYAVDGVNFRTSLTFSADGNTLAVLDFAVDDKNKHFIATSLVVRVIGDHVLIEQDDNDKPLVDALVKAGIPREQIILAYAGEPLPAGA